MAILNASTSAGLVTAINAAMSGDEIRLAGGNYSKFHYTTPKTFSPSIKITSADKNNPANFNEGTTKFNGLKGSEGAFFITNVFGLTIDGVNFVNNLTQNADVYQGVGWPAGVGVRLGLQGSLSYISGQHRPNFGNIVFKNCNVSDWFRSFEMGRGYSIEIAYNRFAHTGMDNIRCFEETRSLEIHHNLFESPRIDILRSNEKWYPSGGKERHPDVFAQFGVPINTKNTTATADDEPLADGSRDMYIHHNYCTGHDHYAHSLFIFNERGVRGAHLGETGRWSYNARVEWNYIEAAHTNAIALAGCRRLNPGDPLNISHNCIRTIAPNTYADTPKINIYKANGTTTSKLIIENNVVSGGVNEFDAGAFDTCTLIDNVTSNTAFPVGWATNGPTKDTVGPYKESVDLTPVLPTPMTVELTPPTMVTFSSGNTGTSDITSHVITLPTGQIAGDTLLAVISVDGAPTVTAGADWTKIGQNSNGTEVTQALFSKVLTSATNSLTITTSTAQQLSYVVYRLIDSTGISAGFVNGSGADTNPIPFSPTDITTKDRLWIVARSGDAAVLPTASPEFFTTANTAAASGANGANTAVAWRHYHSNTLDPGIWTVDTEQWVCSTICVEPKTTDRVAYHGSFGELIDIGQVETSYQSGIFQKMYTGIFLVPPTSPAYNANPALVQMKWIKSGLTSNKPMVLSTPSTDVNGWQRWEMRADFPASTPNASFPTAHRVHAVEVGQVSLVDLQVQWKLTNDANYSILTPYKRTLTSPATPVTVLTPLTDNDWDFVEVTAIAEVNRYTAKLRIRTNSAVPQNIISGIEWTKDLVIWHPTEQIGTYTPDGQKLWTLKPSVTGGVEHTVQYGKQSNPIWIRYTATSSALASAASTSSKTFIAPDLPTPEVPEKEPVVIGGNVMILGGLPVSTVSQNRPQNPTGFSFTPYISGDIVNVTLPNSIPEDTEYYSVGYNGHRYTGTALVTFPYVDGKDLVTIKGVSFKDPITNRRSSSRTLFFFLVPEEV